MQLNKEQKEAVEYLEGPLLVLAGPGTGKTQLLSSKVEYILKNTDTNPQNILCLTYTENGAQNMRDRLFSIIGQSAGQVAIHTYHAFGTVILSAYKNYATNFDRQLDEPISTVMQYKIIREIQDNLDGTDILRGDSIKDIAETIDKAKAARLTPDDLQKIAKDNLEITKKLNTKIQKPLKNLIPRMKVPDALAQVYHPLYDIFVEQVSADEIAPGIFREVNEYAVELKKLIDEQETALADVAENGKSASLKPSVSPLNKWKDRRFEHDSNGDYRLSNIIANKKLISLANVMKLYDERLKEEGWYDFSDMIEQAIQILKSDEGFRLTLSERYQFILLDEFQDTNRSQAELVNLLTDGVERPCIMAVGDDDQAICEFQGANASNMFDFQQHYGAKYINLSRNYRSTSEILALGRQVADQIENSFSKGNAVEKKLSAELDKKIKSAHKDAEVSRHEFASADAEYYWVANEIANLIKKGVPQKQIAIITAKHKYIPPLLPYLKSHEGINITYEKRENLFDDPAISELLTLAKFIYELSLEQAPSYPLLQILSFPFWGLDPVACAQASARDRNKTTFERLQASPDPKIQALATTFAELVALSYDTPLELFIDNLTDKTNFTDYYCKTDAETFALYDKLHSLKRALSDYIRTDRPTLKDLVAFMDDYAEANMPLASTSPYQDADDAVQIVTVQKSKGLEYEYAFVLALDNSAWGKAKGNNNKLALPANLIKIRHTGTTDDERLRLLFVAITRAKHHLYLTNSLVDFQGKKQNRLDYLGEYVTQDENGEDIIFSPRLGQKVITHYDNLDEAKRETDLRLSWISAYRETEVLPALKPLLLKNLERYQLSATHLTSFIDLAYAGPVEFFRRNILRVDDEPGDASLEYGNLVHAVFQAITEKGISDDEVIELFKAEANKLQILDSDRKRLIERGEYELKIALETFKDILRDPNSKAEVDLRPEHIHFDTIPLIGKLDHIAIDKDSRTIKIYDFKTSKYKDEYAGNRWNTVATLYKYRLQLLFYKKLLNLSPTYQNYKVSELHILFVSPDEREQKVHDLICPFDEKDEIFLGDLIRAVYNHIKSLDFLENDELFIAPDSQKYSLKDIKAFAQTLIETGQF